MERKFARPFDLISAVLAYVNGKLVTTVEPIDSLYFITIPADEEGTVTFALESAEFGVQNSEFRIQNSPDAHYGTPEQPVLLGTQTSSSATVTAYPTVFTDKVTFYVGENQYENKEISVTVCDALGRQLLQEVRPIVNSQFSTLNLKDLSSGVYFATVSYGNSVTTVKLIKK